MAASVVHVCLLLTLISVKSAEILSIEGLAGIILVFCKCTKIISMHLTFCVHLLVQKYLKTLFAFWSKSLAERLQLNHAPIAPPLFMAFPQKWQQ